MFIIGHLRSYGWQIQQEGLDGVRVQEQLFGPDRTDRLATVQVLDELGNEAVDKLDAELGEVFARGGQVVPDQRDGLLHVLDE